MSTNNPTPFTDRDLAILVEEFVTLQRGPFTLRDLCSYIVYWGMEEHRISGLQLPEEQMQTVDHILERIVRDGRIRVAENGAKYINQ